MIHAASRSPTRTAGKRNEHAFRQQLPNESRPTRADGEANADFLAPFGGAREQQVGEIHAGEQQDERADGGEHAGEREDQNCECRG